MKYIKLFEEHADYEDFVSGGTMNLPNVSHCVVENEVHYNPIPDPYGGHALIDFGLPSGTLWAIMNVGATGVTDFGGYYEYGKGADDLSITNGNLSTKYMGTEIPLAASADTATQVWGEPWHMPTDTQIDELVSNTTYEWVENYQGSGVNGGAFTANGKTLFIPAGGRYLDGEIAGIGEYGGIWSSRHAGESNAYHLGVDNYGPDTYINGRIYAENVRGVVG